MYQLLNLLEPPYIMHTFIVNYQYSGILTQYLFTVDFSLMWGMGWGQKLWCIVPCRLHPRCALPTFGLGRTLTIKCIVEPLNEFLTMSGLQLYNLIPRLYPQRGKWCVWGYWSVFFVLPTIMWLHVSIQIQRRYEIINIPRDFRAYQCASSWACPGPYCCSVEAKKMVGSPRDL